MSPKPGAKAGIGALRLLLRYLRPYRWRVAFASVALLVAAGLVLALGQGLRHLIDGGFAQGSSAQLNDAAGIMAGVVAGLALSSAARFYLVSWLGERVAADIRRDVFNKVISLSSEFFESARTGDILSRMTADVSVLQALIGSAMSQLLRNSLMSIGAFAMLVITSARLALLVAVIVPLVIGPLILFARREKKLSRAAQDRVADLGAYAEETLNALRTVQAFTHEPVDRALFAGRVEDSVQAALQRVRTRAMLILGIIFLGFGAITFSLWVGGQDVIAGKISGGDLSAFIFYAVLLASSGANMSELWGDMQRAAGAADRLQETLLEEPTIAAPLAPVTMPLARGAVRFEDVVFHYPARPLRAALHGFSLEVKPGETVALVGPSGAGKTTVFQLLLRFYDPRSGVIRVDGVDIATVDPADLRGRIGMVSQDPVIFSANAWENIRYGRPDASNAEVRKAADAAAASGFLADLPDGFDTFLGEKGVRLSGGQRQRIAIARAVLRDPPILLLDEATSALDAESEQLVQRALVELAKNRTTLVIAHRLATVRNADRIVVIEAGKVVATGRHEELMDEGGLYRRLAELQFM